MNIYAIHAETTTSLEVKHDKEADIIRLPPLGDGWYYEIEK